MKYWSALLVATSLATAAPSHADGRTEACVAAAERAQALRDQHQLTEALREAIECGHEECPLIIRRDCAELRDQLRRKLPSVVVRVRVNGQDRITLETRSPTPGSAPIAAWIAGGGVVVGVAGFICFGLKTHANIDYLESTCAPRCSDSVIQGGGVATLGGEL